MSVNDYASLWNTSKHVPSCIFSSRQAVIMVYSCIMHDSKPYANCIFHMCWCTWPGCLVGTAGSAPVGRNALLHNVTKLEAEQECVFLGMSTRLAHTVTLLERQEKNNGSSSSKLMRAQSYDLNVLANQEKGTVCSLQCKTFQSHILGAGWQDWITLRWQSTVTSSVFFFFWVGGRSFPLNNRFLLLKKRLVETPSRSNLHEICRRESILSVILLHQDTPTFGGACGLPFQYFCLSEMDCY